MKNFTFRILSLMLFLWCIPNLVSAQGDDCASAVDVSGFGYCLKTTADGPNAGAGVASNCNTGAANADWYSFTPAVNMTVTVSSGNDPAATDTRLGIYSGDCATLTCVASDDDAGPGFTSVVTGLAVTAGTTYYIEWDDRWSGNGFEWEITSTDCAAPTSVSATSAVSGTVEVTYVEVTAGDVTHIEYGAAGFTPGTGTLVAATGSPQTIVDAVNIADCGTVDVYVYNDCLALGVDADCPTVMGSTATVCPCGAPSAITLTDVGDCVAGAVDASWTSGMIPDDYEVEIGAAGFAPGTGAEVAANAVTGGLMSSFTGLTVATSYEVYVRHNCGSGFSAWVGPVAITTGGAPGGCDCPTELTGLSYCETYNEAGAWTGGTASNVCATGATDAAWYSFVAPGTGTIDIESISGNDTRVGLLEGACAALTCVASDDDSGTSGGFSSLISDAAVIAGTTYYIEWDDRWGDAAFDWTLTFDCDPVTADAGTATVSGSVDVTYTGTVTHLEYGAPGFTPGTGTLVAATASPQTITDAVIITDCGTVDVYVYNDCLGLGVDADCTNSVVAVNTFCPCGDPGSVTATDASTCNVPAVDVTWTTGMAPDDYEVEIGAAGFTPGTGTQVAAAAVTGGLMQSFTMADGLAVGTGYEVYVRHNCGSGFSAWNGPAAVSTGGLPGSACDCPTDVAIAACTTTVTEAGGFAGTASNVCFGTGGTTAAWYSMTPTVSGTVTITALSTDTRLSIYDDCPVTNCIGSNDDGVGVASQVADLAVTANTTYHIEWDDRWSTAGFDWTIDFTCLAPAAPTAVATATTSMEVTYGADVTGIEIVAQGAGAGTGTIVAATASPQTITDATIADCASVDIYLYNDCLGDAACAGLSTVVTVPTFCPCAAPTGITAVDVTTCDGSPTATIDVAWTSDNMPDAYDVEIGAVGFAPGTGAEGAAMAAQTGGMTQFTGLALGTDFEVYVQHDCTTGTGGASAWIGPIAVTTAASTVAGSSCDCPTDITDIAAVCAPINLTAAAPTGTAANVCATGATLSNWYSYTPAVNQTVTISAALDPAVTDTRLSIYDGCGNCFASDDDSGPGFTSTVTTALVAGTTYTIEWDNRWTDNGFEWYIAEDPLPSANVVLPGVTTASTVAGCDDPNGWTYYEDTGNPGTYLLAILWDADGDGSMSAGNAGAKAAAVVDIIMEAGTFYEPAGNSAAEASVAMARSWNVRNAGSMDEPVNVKFFYDPAEKTAAEAQLATYSAANNGWSWYKNTGGDYSHASVVTAPDFQANVTLLAEAGTGIENGVTYVQFDGVTGFSGGSGAIGTGTGFLPIELASFEGKAMEKTNMLTWETSMEENTKSFTIERSVNGRDWITIGTKAAAGNSDVTIAYSLEDNNPLAFANYRLRTTDNDASEYFSHLIRITRKGAGFDIVNISPNPTKGFASVAFSVGQSGKVEGTLTSITGQLISTFKHATTEGLNSMKVDLSNVPSGVYFLKMNNGVNNITRRIVKN